MDSDDEYLLKPGTSIKTHRSDADDEDEVAVEPGDATSNTVMLFEDKVKLESISTELACEDPLNILNKLEIKVEPTEISVEFQGEYNESDFLNTDSTLAEVVTDAVCSGRNKNKRMRTSASEFRIHKSSVWSNTKPTSADVNEDILKQPLAPKGKGPARLVANILEAWHLLIDEPIISNILKYTNEEIKSRKSKTSGTSSLQRSTDLLELRAWIGLNYLSGVFRVGGGSLEELWTPELGNGIFRACMSLKRFEYLNDCLKLSEKPKKTTKSQGAGVLHDVAGVWEKFIINCRSYYAPSSNCTLEEHVLDMANTDYPEGLKHCITNDPERSGIRLVSLHDSKTRYMCNAVIGLSAAPIQEEVLVLVCDIKGTKRNVTLSQRYTSLELANHLQQCQLTLVGSLAMNSKDFPTELTTAKGRQTTRRLYAGSVSLIVAENNDQDVLLTTGISEKINAEKLYEVTVLSGKRYFESSAVYSTESAVVINNSTKYRWTLRFFHAMLDFACLNAWLLFRLSHHGNADMQQRDFQRQLGLFLTQQHLKRRLQRNSKIPLQLKLLISEILGDSPDALIAEAVSAAAQASSAGAMPLDHASVPSHIQLLSKTTPKRNRCRVCPSKNNIKTRWQCQQCGRALCLSHLVMRCDECTGLKKEQPEKNGEKDEFFK